MIDLASIDTLACLDLGRGVWHIYTKDEVVDNTVSTELQIPVPRVYCGNPNISRTLDVQKLPEGSISYLQICRKKHLAKLCPQSFGPLMACTKCGIMV
jgi:hypothetical protein